MHIEYLFDYVDVFYRLFIGFLLKLFMVDHVSTVIHYKTAETHNNGR